MYLFVDNFSNIRSVAGSEFSLIRRSSAALNWIARNLFT
uniref:Uncharacterized protein n=1 Tax=Heterorhabditis bacteriophora TaxID=37862 RepID=A0A1I7WAG9_HETBA